ncbi:hypothetical protein, partial [Bacteroides xylanisolvens]
GSRWRRLKDTGPVRNKYKTDLDYFNVLTSGIVEMAEDVFLYGHSINVYHLNSCRYNPDNRLYYGF